ncbi:hypothetical protein CEXT_481531 [Caerostris extrusa]|uniref:Uncharacterized protein n=1 Tax=Caerostris extrusa TaxID=172846 RepID=A0AAV4Y984_CAEEX|nr:hypothetical protein CEXT_481531 [Caerostris extrusa]
MQKENASTAREATQPSTEDAQISPRRIPPPQKRIYLTPRKNQRTKIYLEENSINRQISPEGGKRTYANIINNQNEQAHPSTNIPSKLPKPNRSRLVLHTAKTNSPGRS